jgi:penicillin-binding protein 1A
MKAATLHDKAEWLTAPAGVTSAKVCRLSGLLATDGCDDVEVVGTNGKLERRSMIYNEYFAKGTEPSAFCDQHPTRGIMTKLAGIFGGSDDRPAPPHVEDTGAAAPNTAATAGAVVQTENPPPPPKKKRGFWSRLFGKDRDSEERETQPPVKKKGG